MRTVRAPGRVNLIGDHTDYMGGLVLPMAVQLGTTITTGAATPAGTSQAGTSQAGTSQAGTSNGAERLVMRSDRLDGVVDLALPIEDPSSVSPSWGRYVAAVAASLGVTTGIDAVVTSDLPIGGGLSSSSSLAVATALALGAHGTPLEIAHLCRDAEEAATGVPCGIMDQLAIAGGVDGHALMIDCATETVTPIRVPTDAHVWVLDSGQARELAGSEYATRRGQAEAAVAIVGPLAHAAMADIEALADPVVRARARHVRTECDRVRAFAAALGADDLVRAGQLMVESHQSLRDDYEVSTDALDALVERVTGIDGVYGARLTGAGFGGCVVALARPEVVLDGVRVQASAGAAVLD